MQLNQISKKNWKLLTKSKDYLSKIFSLRSKVIANSDNVLEFLKTGNTAPVLVEWDTSNICNHELKECPTIQKYIAARGKQGGKQRNCAVFTVKHEALDFVKKYVKDKKCEFK